MDIMKVLMGAAIAGVGLVIFYKFEDMIADQVPAELKKFDLFTLILAVALIMFGKKIPYAEDVAMIVLALWFKNVIEGFIKH